MEGTWPSAGACQHSKHCVCARSKHVRTARPRSFHPMSRQLLVTHVINVSRLPPFPVCNIGKSRGAWGPYNFSGISLQWTVTLGSAGTRVSGHYREGGLSSGVAFKRGPTVLLKLYFTSSIILWELYHLL